MVASVPSALLTEQGATGLRTNYGRVEEEPLRKLQGDAWRTVLAEMTANDAIVGAVLRSIELLMRQVTWQMVPATDEPDDEEASTFVQECLDDMSASWEDTLSEIVSFLPWGWSYLETVYKLRGGETETATTRSRFDDGRIGWRKWSIRSQDSLVRWEFDEEGGIQGMVQMVPPGYEEVMIPITKALLFRTTSRKNSPEGYSILRNAYVSWFYKHQLERLEAIVYERFAGIPKVSIPSEVINTGGQPLEMWKQVATNLRRHEQAGLVIPSNRDERGNRLYDVELMTTPGESRVDFDTPIRRYGADIAKSTLNDFIVLGHDGVGSYALANSKTNMFATALSAWLDAITGVINRHAIPRLLRLNGVETPNGLPTLQHGEVERIDFAAFGELIERLTKAGVELTLEDERYIREKVGLPVPETTEEEEDNGEDEDTLAPDEPALLEDGKP